MKFSPDTDRLLSEIRSIWRRADARASPEIAAAIGALLAPLGFGGFSLVVLWRGPERLAAAPVVAGGSLASVGASYLAEGLLDDDPFMQVCYEAATPVFWADYLAKATRRGGGGVALRVADLLGAAGLTAGVTLPLACDGAAVRGAFALAAPAGADPAAFATDFDRQGWAAEPLGTLMLARADRLLRRSDAPVLSNSERAVLTALARGQRTLDIAAATGKSPHTIRNQIGSAQAKLGARTTVQAIARAVAAGIVRP